MTFHTQSACRLCDVGCTQLDAALLPLTGTFEWSALFNTTQLAFATRSPWKLEFVLVCSVLDPTRQSK